MSHATPIPDLSAHLDAAERAAAALTAALRACLDAVPDEPRFASVRDNFIESLRHTEHAIDFHTARGILAEIARPKGPMVKIRYPSVRGPATTGHAELAEVTGAAFIMRGGARYSRKTGKEVGYKWTAWSAGAPYITAGERARILALPRPPRPARKEPRK